MNTEEYDSLLKVNTYTDFMNSLLLDWKFKFENILGTIIFVAALMLDYLNKACDDYDI